MGLWNTLIRRQYFRAGWQRPWDGEAVVQIVGWKSHGDDLVTLDVLHFSGVESPWQPPERQKLRTILPAGVTPRVGQRVVIGSGGGGRGDGTPPPVYWERPEPPPPKMQFPNFAGGEDPKVMLAQLEVMVQQGTLPPEGLERARAYLESGTWLTD